MAQVPAGEPQTHQGPLPLWIKLVALVCLAPLIAVLLPTFLVASVGMLPSLVVYICDKTRNKHFALTVALMNTCGILPALAELWGHGQTMGLAAAKLTDPVFWFMSVGSAAVGWLVFMGMPPLIAAYYHTASDARLQNLLARQQGLIETWGEEVRGEEVRGEPAGTDGEAPEGETLEDSLPPLG